MLGVVYNGPWDVKVQDKKIDLTILPDEVLIKVKMTGICGTDLNIITGKYEAALPGTILGHETVGEVIQIGESVPNLQVGERVVVDPTYYCGHCRFCRTNRKNHCESKTQLETGVSSDGAFTNYHKTKYSFLYKLPDNLSYEVATLTEPLSCVLTGIKCLTLHTAMNIVVIGGGPMGLLYSLALAAKGYSGVVVENQINRQHLVKDVIDPKWRLATNLKGTLDVFDGTGTQIDVVIDTSGCAVHDYLHHLSRGGQVLSIALKQQVVGIDLGWIADESISFYGSIDSLNNSFNEALALLANGAIPGSKLITHKLPVRKFHQAVKLLGLSLEDKAFRACDAAIKILVQPEGEENEA
ncbi:zinc-dependent alcohol dehydrogenase [Salipaludibacillus agaradhaerens]|jgi:threonine dehydrogenase-like Zn-dependent dehydrogenase|uniref:zinc-dependent alcohol dehydrogenase n=1 Tax=Salipaludibacillus agaradhaerens TaxID=76935 RepID=UPI0009967C5A|nr:alcohol dehydrogenase catalytic domain-containing protein [Salipaludibacillus agaradhaerens]